MCFVRLTQLKWRWGATNGHYTDGTANFMSSTNRSLLRLWWSVALAKCPCFVDVAPRFPKSCSKFRFPSKKVFGNQSVAFVQRRQAELEGYVQRLLSFYPRPPPVLARFLHWDKHELHGITASLSAYLFQVQSIRCGQLCRKTLPCFLYVSMKQ